jgi:hypothetical protein
MPTDPDDVFVPGEEVSQVPFIEATPVQEDERGVDLESDDLIVPQIREDREVVRTVRRPHKESSWFNKAFFPFSLCLIGMSAFLILYLILR